jgi:hypothetical protein
VQMPGETLIAKLWETLVDKGIGNLIKPSKMRREGKAHIDVKRSEILILAQATRDAEAIRKGELTVCPSGLLLPISASSISKNHAAEKNPNTISYRRLPRQVDRLKVEILPFTTLGKNACGVFLLRDSN